MPSNGMNEFSATECIKFGWETFKKRPWFFIGVFLLYFIVSEALTMLINPYGVVWPDLQNNIPADFSLPRVVVTLVDMLIGAFLMMLIMIFTIRAHDDPETIKISDAWKPEIFPQYVLVSFLTFVIIGLGFILLIIPGIFALVVLLFAPYIVLDKRMNAIAALKESMAITKGNWWNVLTLLLISFGVIILGVLALVVGLLVAIPVVYFATVHAYRVLSAKAEAIVPAAPTTPVVG